MVGAIRLVALGVTLGPLLAAPPKPVPAPAPAPTGEVSGAGTVQGDPLDPRAGEAARLQLEKLPGGKYRYVGTQDERFDAHINRDGTVTFMIDAQVQVQVGGVCLVALCVSRTPGRGPKNPGVSKRSKVAQKARRTGASLATSLLAGAAASLSRQSGGGTGSPNDYGQMLPPNWMNDPNRNTQPPAPVLGMVHGRYGYLPRPDAQMAAFLERTFEFRLVLARQAHVERNAKALAQLPHRLLDVWSDDSRPARVRRAEILALWDELDADAVVGTDTPLSSALTSETDTRRQAAARRGRSVIEAFVRRHLPADSGDAFTKEELRQFNAARTRRDAGAVAFDPYAASR